MEQLVARRAHNPKVAGSSPAPATKQIADSEVFGNGSFIHPLYTYGVAEAGGLLSRYLQSNNRAYSSMVEHPAHNRLVPGSSPGGPTSFIMRV